MERDRFQEASVPASSAICVSSKIWLYPEIQAVKALKVLEAIGLRSSEPNCLLLLPLQGEWRPRHRTLRNSPAYRRWCSCCVAAPTKGFASDCTTILQEDRGRPRARQGSLAVAGHGP